MDNELDWLVKKYGERAPFEGETEFFKSRPEVAGMAAEDGQIVMNPQATLSPVEMQAVRRNEALRLHMRQNPMPMEFEPTAQQKEFFAGTEYGSDPQAARETILARILTGDPSVGTPSSEQLDIAKALRQQIQSSSAAQRSLAPQAPAAMQGVAQQIDKY